MHPITQVVLVALIAGGVWLLYDLRENGVAERDTRTTSERLLDEHEDNMRRFYATIGRQPNNR